MEKGHAGGGSMRKCVETETLADLVVRYPQGFACPVYGNTRCTKMAGHTNSGRPRMLAPIRRDQEHDAGGGRTSTS